VTRRDGTATFPFFVPSASPGKYSFPASRIARRHCLMNHFEHAPYSPPPAGFQEGKLASWDDKKGFGSIELHGRRVFAHVKEFERGQRRPEAGEMVKFIQAVDAQGRPCAKTIRFVREGGRIGSAGGLGLLLLLALPVVAMTRLPVAWWIIPSWMTLISVITYGYYASDKKRAQAAEWRIPEARLHLAALFGGWPGAWIAQRRLRHKTVKASFQFVFWLIVLLYQLAAVDVLMERRGSKALMEGVGHLRAEMKSEHQTPANR
jgi:uncharacterized membrane protein YsdA (DUF1294 family)/cold shock CspA family protein